MSEVLAQLKKKGGSADLTVTKLFSMQNVNTFPVKKDALYFLIVWANGSNVPTFTEANVQVIDSGAYSTGVGSGYHRYIVIIKALENGTVKVSTPSQFRGCEVYEVTAE